MLCRLVALPKPRIIKLNLRVLGSVVAKCNFDRGINQQTYSYIPDILNFLSRNFYSFINSEILH